jgi:TIR domain
MTVFISYSHHDKAFAEQLTTGFVAANVKVWRDTMRIREGDRLEPAILDAIRAAKLIVVLISTQSAKSSWVTRETEFALDRERQGLIEVVPVVVEHGAGLTLLNDRLTLDGGEGPASIVRTLVDRALAAASPSAAGQRVSDDARCYTHHNRQIGQLPDGRAIIQLDIVSFDLDAPYSILTQFTFVTKEPVDDIPDDEARALSNRVMQDCAESFDADEWRIKLHRDATKEFTFTVVDAQSGWTFTVEGRALRLGRADRGNVLFNVGALFRLILPDD